MLCLSTAVPAHAADCPQAGPCVAVHLPGGDVQVLSASTIAADADVMDTQYSTRPGPEGEPYVGTGLSVHHLLQVLVPPVDPSAVGFTELTANDHWTTLTGGDLADPSDFDDGLLPVFYVDGSVIRYVRPLRPGSSDTNASDQTAGSRLDLYVHAGRLLAVTAAASPSTAGVGQPVTLTATSDSTVPPTFTWDFADGTTATGTSVVHAFGASQSYDVVVTATGADDSGGQAGTRVVVTAPAAATPSPTPSPSPAVHPSAGPVASAAPTAAATGQPGPRSQRGPTSVPGRPGPGTSTVAGSPTSAPSPRPSAVRQPAGTPISGVLLGAAPAAAGAPTVRGASAAPADGNGSDGRRTVGGVAAVLALLVLGAVRERR